MASDAHEREIVKVDDLRPHPRNYLTHPPDQIAHLVASIRQFGFFRNVVIARDGTILAGHGAVEAARQAGLDAVPAVRLDLDPGSALALKVLALDNELPRRAQRDGTALTEILRLIHNDDSGLLGTGYDDAALARLLADPVPASALLGDLPDIRQIMLVMTAPQFERAVALLAAARERTGAESDSEVLLALLDGWAATEGVDP